MVSIGSLLVGGAGKTPIASLCIDLLHDLDVPAALLLRGYKGTARAPQIAYAPGDEIPPWRAIGDEAWMAATRLASLRRDNVVVAVGRSRRRSLELARRIMPSTRIAILDDGFQHFDMPRDLDIVLVPPRVDTLALLPSGPLREPVSALSDADLVWLHQGAGDPVPEREMTIAGRRADIVSHYRFDGLRQVWPRGGQAQCPNDATVLTAVGRNRNVHRLLEANGFARGPLIALRDHRAFPRHLGATLRAGATITTAKDWPRLRELARSSGTTQGIWVVEVALELQRGAETLRESLEALC